MWRRRSDPLRRKLLRDLWDLKAAAATIVFILAVGVASLEGFLGTYRDMVQARDEYYEDFAYAEAHLVLRRAPLAIVDEVARLPGIDRIEARLVEDLPFELPGVARRLSARLHSIPEHGAASLNRLRLMDGRLPAPGGAPEVVVAADFARARQVRPGATLDLVTDRGIRTARVVGVAMSPEYVFVVPSGGGAVPAPRSFAVLWGRRDFVAETLDFEGAFNSLLVRAGRGTAPESLARRIERYLRDHGVLFAAPRRDMPSYAVLRDELANLYNQAKFMPVIFLLGAALVMNLVLTRLVATQRIQIGTLKALGVPRRRILGHYLEFAVILGGLGGLLGAAGGQHLAGLLHGVYARFYHLPPRPPELYPDLVLGGLGVALLAGALGVLRAGLTALRLPPAEAMRPAPPELQGAPVPRVKGLPLLWRVALRSLIRHPYRALVSALGVGLGAGLLISSRFFTDSMTQLSDFRFRVIQRYDVQVRLRDGVGRPSEAEVASVPGVTGVEVAYGDLFEMTHGRATRRVFLRGIRPDASLERPRRRDGTPVPIPPAGLLLCEKLAEVLGVEPGDSVTLRSLRTRKVVEAAPVAATYPSYLGMDAFADLRWLGRSAGEPEALTHLNLRAPHLDGAAYRTLGQRPGVLRVSRRADRVAGFEGSVKGVLDAVALIMVGLAGALACGMNLAGALVTVAERRRELAVLRVQGYTAGEVGDLLLHEHTWVALFGLAAGLPLGRSFARWCQQGFDTELYRLPWVLGRTNLTQAMVYSVVFAAVAHGVVRWWVSRQGWREDLSVKE